MAEGWLEHPINLIGKKIWVAGHNGMVGQSLVRALQKEKAEILTENRDTLDLRRQADVEEWVKANKPDMIILAAATVGGIGANAAEPAKFFYDNIMIATNVIETAHKKSVQKLLFLGSSCIYPRKNRQPIQEQDLLSGALEPTNEAYALAKIGGLKMAQYYRTQYSCDFISAMPCNLYGPGDYYDAERSHVIPALIMKAHEAKIEGADHLTVWGTGKALREFLYVDDLADALLLMLKQYSGVSHMNIGSAEEVSIGALAKQVSDAVGFKGKIVLDTSKPDGTPRKVMDSNTMRRSGWSASTSLEQGLARAYEDYLVRYGPETKRLKA